jgi:two-component system, NtrC family, response regulator GlrR
MTAQTTEVVAGAPPTVQQFRLSVTSGPDAGAVYVSTGDRAVLGTAASAQLVLTDPAVSRFHAELAIVDGRAQIRDLDSTNGTRVSGVAIAVAFLASGDLITLGRTQVRFDLGAAQVAIAVSARDRFGLLVGRSVAQRAVFEVLERAAASTSTVLLEGETGTGKEAAAESIHVESDRRGQPFIVVDCGAIPSELLESELFGHERGAFTGAVAARTGAFAAADGGTIFLDEIGELAPALQPKLLRALERREIKPVGATAYQPVDVRVIAATNRNLRAEVNARRFRADLYYRLAVLEVRLPPLRERREDLPVLVEHLLGTLGAADDPRAAGLRTPWFLAELERHSWPGNVRELRNYVERALADITPLEPAPVTSDHVTIDVARPLKEIRNDWIRALERRYLDEIVRRHDGNITAAARAAGLDRIYFYRLLWRHGLR